MKALVLKEFNQPFALVDVMMPVVGPNQVLVRIIASGVNPLDIKIKSGQAGHAQTKLPAILGIDMAGVVEEVGQGVSRFKVGNEVYGMVGGIAGVPGTLAEYAAVDADLLALKPKNLSFRESAALPLIFITAWEGLVDRANVKENQKVLIQGGAGGVGHIATQLAKSMGADVYATASPTQFETIKRYWATPIDYTQPAEEYMNRYTDDGFDIVFDTVGGKVLDASFGVAKRYTGHVISILGWGSHSLAPLSFRGATYSGVFTLYPLISGKGRSQHGEILKRGAALIEQGLLKPMVSSKRYSMETIEEAYDAMQNGKVNGKLIIDISNY